jgi:hypothetical protein
MSITLRDQDTYETAQPGDSITWTATISGVAVQLKFDGDPSFQDSLTSAYASIGDYWGAEPTFVFDVDAGDVGSTIVLAAASSPFRGQSVTKTHDILVVVAMTRYATFECVMTDTGFPAPAAPFDTHGYGTRMYMLTGGFWGVPWCFLLGWQAGVYDPPEWGYSEGADTLGDFGVYLPVDDGDPWILGTTAVGTLIIKALRLTDGETYSVIHRHEATAGTDATFDYTLKVYEGGVLQTTTTKQVVKSDGDPLDSLTTWLTIDGSTGDVTVVNP